METLVKAFMFVTGFVALVFILGILTAWPVMWLWNYVVAGVFHLPALDIWQAWALAVLCSLLFKSSGSSK